ncbi:DUF4189 domain-containing protein [Neisseria sp. CCUG12390]|uniref:DUF4189 domain-containing protein n=1 Tax=Neisseria sp. CCUG12390 TaxID=3392035 RepID=UPI003A10106E
MKKILSAFALCALAVTAQAADSYGYLAFWQNPADSSDGLRIKTTRENLNQVEAANELAAYCRGQDALAGVQADQATGCQSVMPLQNTCAAVAYPRAHQRMTTENVVVISSPLFKSLHQTALNQCAKKFGTQGQCAIEASFCTSSDYYGGAIRTLWSRIKSL